MLELWGRLRDQLRQISGNRTDPPNFQITTASAGPDSSGIAAGIHSKGYWLIVNRCTHRKTVGDTSGSSLFRSAVQLAGSADA
jgi:hypothetical protein